MISCYKDELKIAIEYEKVLKILFDKNVSISLLKVKDSVDDYNPWTYSEILTKDEFDLLKSFLNKFCSQ